MWSKIWDNASIFKTDTEYPLKWFIDKSAIQTKLDKSQFAYVEKVVHSFSAHQQSKIIFTVSQVHCRYYKVLQLIKTSNSQNTFKVSDDGKQFEKNI